MRTLLNNYRSFIKSGEAMRAELSKMLAGKQYLPDATINALAGVHAECYGAHAVQKESGAWVFYTTSNPEEQTRDAVHEAAKKQWSRTIAPLHNYARKDTPVRNKASEADRYINAFEKLPKSARRAVAAYIASLKTV
jgi:hypothetical protein